MIVKEIQAKSVVVKSNLPAADYVVNPYTGCEHACIYCYAEFMKRFTGHTEPWGTFVDAKVNVLEVLGNTEKFRGKVVLFSSVTDPYGPIEAKYKLTRKVLEALVPSQPKIEILTKARLVVRDVDVLKKFDDVTVGVSLATMDEKLSKQLEPRAALPRLRIETLKKCKEAGLRTYLFVSPIFPGITDVGELIEKAKDYVDFFMFENLNVRGLNKARVFEFVKENRPELLPLYEDISNKEYWDEQERLILEKCEEVGKEARVHFHHGGFK